MISGNGIHLSLILSGMVVNTCLYLLIRFIYLFFGCFILNKFLKNFQADFFFFTLSLWVVNSTRQNQPQFHSLHPAVFNTFSPLLYTHSQLQLHSLQREPGLHMPYRWVHLPYSGSAIGKCESKWLPTYPWRW